MSISHILSNTLQMTKQAGNQTLHTLIKVPLLLNHIQTAIDKHKNIKLIKCDKNMGETIQFPMLKHRLTLMTLGWVAMRTMRAPERLGKLVSWNCSQNFHGIWSPEG
jgi:hypothetical protein